LDLWGGECGLWVDWGGMGVGVVRGGAFAGLFGALVEGSCSGVRSVLGKQLKILLEGSEFLVGVSQGAPGSGGGFGPWRLNRNGGASRATEYKSAYAG